MGLIESARALLPDVETAAVQVYARLAGGGIGYSSGNGGSAADARHLAGDLRYRRDRRALPAVALSTDPTMPT